jgi:hypothetical protein
MADLRLLEVQKHGDQRKNMAAEVERIKATLE